MIPDAARQSLNALNAFKCLSSITFQPTHHTRSLHHVQPGFILYMITTISCNLL
jgi:hypothetical protein